MDIAGFEAIVTREIKTWQESESTYAIQSLKFQNHLYGCFAILEYLGEGSIEFEDSSGQAVLCYKDASGSTFSCEQQFRLIGCEFGFLQDQRGFFDGWPNSYRDYWIWIWKTLGKEKKLDEIDVIEAKLFQIIQEHRLPFFADAIKEGRLGIEKEKEALELLEKPERRHFQESGTRRAKRAITPIARRKKFRKTRKLLHTDNLVIRQSLH